MSGVYLAPRNPVGGLEILEFPYTPQIDYSNDVRYDSFSLTHTNYQPYAFVRSENPQLSLNCKFSAHTKEHFAISERAIRFLRTYTKMNYGREDPERGQPPRILRFFAHGNPIFHNVPVVINKFNITFPEDVDYIKGTVDFSNNKTNVQNAENVGNRSVATTNTSTTDLGTVTVTASKDKAIYLPAFFQISISLLVQQNIAKTVNEFTLEKFATGQMSKYGYI